VTAEVVQVDPARPEPAVMARAGALIRAGRLVAFPTETVYGLGANALDAEAVERIFAAKGRPANDPVIAHVADLDGLKRVAASVPPGQRLIERFWPGPLTLVLPRAAGVPPSVSAGLPTVAVRMPSHPVALALLRAAGTPIAAPSANRFSRPSATTAAHVLADLGDTVDLILDAGPATIGIESTILDLSGDGPPVLLRPGGVPLADLQAVVGLVQERDGRDAADTVAQTAPGLLTKHYAPRAKMLVVLGERDAARARLRVELTRACAAGRRVGALMVREDADLVEGLGVVVAWLGSEARLEAVAERLFAAMRELDAAGVEVIGARDYGSAGLGLAIRDRLIRAAAGQVIQAGGAP
jgi:L-threonylcarbamoyladenylate synthase